MEIIGVIIAGIIIGLLGKFVAPGDKDNIPLWLTVLCGIGGVVIGWFIYTAFGGNGSAGIDWVRWIVAIVVAAVLVVVASTVTGRNKSRTPSSRSRPPSRWWTRSASRAGLSAGWRSVEPGRSSTPATTSRVSVSVLTV